MPSAKPPPRKPLSPAKSEHTHPGGPAPDVLEKARHELDATRVYDKSKARPRAEGPKLVVTAGPRKGGEFILSEPRTSVGRGSDNSVVIPDISVSRQHVVVEKQGERWVLLDQGSGNGTRVNGRPVDRHALQHGDQIAMGDTVVQFVEPGGAVAHGANTAQVSRLAAGKPAKRGSLKKRAPLYLAILAALALVLAVGMVRRAQRARFEAESAAGNESRALAAQRFDEGVALLKQGHWVEARDKLKIAAELDRRDPEIARYLESAEAEAPRAEALAAARAAMSRKDYAAARGALAGVPDDSALAEGVQQIQQELRAALETAVREARARAEAGDSRGAAELLEPVLAVEPSRADALAVKEAIGARKPPATAPPPRREERRRAVEAPPAADVAAILDSYLAGDLGAAIQKAESARSERTARLLRELKQFDSSCKDAQAKQQAKNFGGAIRAFEQAASADRAIAQGKEGKLAREVHKALGALHAQLAALQLGSDEALPAAATHLRAALQNDPANEQAQTGLHEVGERAKEIYLRGYVAKDSDAESARKAFKLVIETLPAGDETAEKARRWLDKLEGKVAKEE